MDRDISSGIVSRKRDTRPLRHAMSRLGLLCLLTLQSRSADWPQYRGPNRDGTSPESIRTNWTAQPPQLLWKIPLGRALSSVAAAGGRIFTQERRDSAAGPREFCIAIDAATGSPLWSSDALDDAVYDSGTGSDDGPRSTPSISGDRVVVVTSYLNLVCLDAATGARRWSRDLKSDYGAQGIPWQNAASPLIEGGLVVLNCNGRTGERFVAFRLDTGAEAWKTGPDALTHSSPVTATLGGVRQSIFFTQSGLVALEPAAGTILWRYPLNYNLTSVAASPVVSGDLVYVSRAYPGSLTAARAGAVVVRVTNQAGVFSASRVWARTNALMNHWCTPVAVQGHVYGMFGQSSLTLSCVDLATGTNRWSTSGFGYGSVLGVDGHLIALSETGELVLVRPSPEAYLELGRFRPLTGRCWNAPGLSQGRLYVRSTTELAAVDVSDPAASGVALQAIRLAEGVLQVVVASPTGAALDPARAATITVEAADNPVSDTWQALPGSIMFTNNIWVLADPAASARQHRFYRAVERP